MSDNLNANTEFMITLFQGIGLNSDEAQLYTELLKGPRSHLKLAQATGVNRTKVYRLADELEKRGLVSKQTKNTSTLLVAADPSTLELELVKAEESLQRQRRAFDKLLPTLHELRQESGSDFVVKTYEGTGGFKQMLWHELQTKEEALIFGSGATEDLVTDGRWAEKYREKSVEANYTIREILNPHGKKESSASNDESLEHYSKRTIDTAVLQLDQQVVIYNNTVATYNWRKEQKVGVEIISASHVTMMRQVFESFWLLAE